VFARIDSRVRAATGEKLKVIDVHSSVREGSKIEKVLDVRSVLQISDKACIKASFRVRALCASPFLTCSPDTIAWFRSFSPQRRQPVRLALCCERLGFFCIFKNPTQHELDLFGVVQVCEGVKQDVFNIEKTMLRVLGFVTHVEHPHKFVLSLITILGVTQLQQEAWNLTNDR
jgi:hypothetical protein